MLTPEEKACISRLQKRFLYAEKALLNGELGHKIVPLQLRGSPLRYGSLDVVVSQLAAAGCYRMVLEDYGDRLGKIKKAQTAFEMANSAWLGGEVEIAKEWATLSLTMFLRLRTLKHDPYFSDIAKIVRLARIFQSIGMIEPVNSLRALLQAEFARNPRFISYSFRLMPELLEMGWEEEARTILFGLAPLGRGMDFDRHYMILCRELIALGREEWIWAMSGMGRGARDNDSTRYDAIEGACSLGRYDLAVNFASAKYEDVSVEEDRRTVIGKVLPRLGRVRDWRVVWDLILQKPCNEHWGQTTGAIAFLANIIEHISLAERKWIYRHTAKIKAHQGHEFAFDSNYLNILAWGGPESEIRNVIDAGQFMVKRHSMSIIRAAVHRRFDWLIHYILATQVGNPPNIEYQLEIEWQRHLLGKSNRLHELLNAELERESRNEKKYEFNNLIRFAALRGMEGKPYLVWASKAKFPLSMRFPIKQFLSKIVSSGDLHGFEDHISCFEDAEVILDLTNVWIECLRNRLAKGREATTA